MAENTSKNLAGGGLPHPQYEYSPKYWRRRINRSGNSLHLNIPHPICFDLGIELGCEVIVYVVGKTLCVEKATGFDFWPAVVSAAPEKDKNVSG